MQTSPKLSPKEYILKKREDYHKPFENASASFIGTFQNSIALTQDLYQERAHFLYELLQNVDDNAYPENVPKTAIFCLTPSDPLNISEHGAFVLVSNECGFRDRDVESITDIGKSTKKVAPGSNVQSKEFIGEKGIGFKSVFMVSKCPHIFSNGFQFKLNRDPEDIDDPSIFQPVPLPFVAPTWVDDAQTEKAYNFAASFQSVENVFKKKEGTIIILPLDSKQSFDLIEEMMSKLRAELILFLSKLEIIYFQLPNSIRTIKKQGSGNIFTVYSGSEQSTWFLNTIRCDTSKVFEIKREGIQTAVMSIAIPLGENAARRTYENGVLYAFLPTMQNPRLPFLVHSDFILVPSRDNIMGSRDWNEHLLKQVPSLFCHMVKQGVKNHCMDFWSVLSILVQNKSEFETIRKTILQAIALEKIALTMSGDCILPTSCVIADDETVELLGSEGLDAVKGSNSVQFATKELSKFLRMNPAVWSHFKFIMWGYTDWNSLAHSTKWYIQKPLDWFIRLYSYLAYNNISIRKILISRREADCKPEMLFIENAPLSSSGYYVKKERESLKSQVVSEICKIIPMKLSELLENDHRLRLWMQENFDLHELTELNYCHLLVKSMALTFPSVTIKKKIQLSRYVFDVYFKYFQENQWINTHWKEPFKNNSFAWFIGQSVISDNRIIRPYIYSDHLQLLYGLNGPESSFEDKDYVINVGSIQANVLPSEYFSSKEVCNFVFDELLGFSGYPPPVPAANGEVSPIFPWLYQTNICTEEYLKKVNLLISWMSYFNCKNSCKFSRFSDFPWFPTNKGQVVKPKDIFILDISTQEKEIAHYLNICHPDAKVHNKDLLKMLGMNDFTSIGDYGRCVSLVNYLKRVAENKKDPKLEKLWPIIVSHVHSLLQSGISNNVQVLANIFTSNDLIPLKNGNWIAADLKSIYTFSKELENLATIISSNGFTKFTIVPASTFKYDVTQPFLYQLGCNEHLSSEQIIDLLLFWKGNPQLDRKQIPILYNLLWKTNQDVKSIFTKQALIYVGKSWKTLSEVVWISKEDIQYPVYEKLLESDNLACEYTGLKTFFDKLKVSTEISPNVHLNALVLVANEFNSGTVPSFDIRTFTMYVYSNILKQDFNNKSLPVLSKTKRFYRACDKNIYIGSSLITDSTFEIVDTDEVYVSHLKRLGMISINHLFSHSFHALDKDSNPEIVTEQYLPSHALLWLPKLLRNYSNSERLESTATALQSYSVIKVKRLYTVYHFKDDTKQQHQQIPISYYLYGTQANVVEAPYLPLNQRTFYFVDSIHSLELIVMDIAKLLLDTNEPSQDVLRLLKQFIKKCASPGAEKKMEKIVDKLLEMFQDIKCTDSLIDPRKTQFESLQKLKMEQNEEIEEPVYTFPTTMKNIQIDSVAPRSRRRTAGGGNSGANTESVSFSFGGESRPKTRQKTSHNGPQYVFSEPEVDPLVKQVGRWGEQFVFRYLKEKYPDCEIEWYNATLESGKSADFEVRQNGQVLYYIEVKATNKTSPNTKFFLSQAEWEFAQKERERFQIYRVFGFQAEKQFVRVLSDPFGMYLEGQLNLKSTDKYTASEIL